MAARRFRCPRAFGGNPDLVGDIAPWVVPARIIGGRIYFDVTSR
jgi:hypothetical protein